jgi:hypothetical protein
LDKIGTIMHASVCCAWRCSVRRSTMILPQAACGSTSPIGRCDVVPMLDRKTELCVSRSAVRLNLKILND